MYKEKINPTDHKNDDLLKDKLDDAMVPGNVVEFDPPEAERVGAFEEDALSEDDAMDSAIDNLDMD